MRDAIEQNGLSGLVAKDSKAALENEARQLEETKQAGSVGNQTLRETFDPLMSMHWHWTNAALHNGGLYLMTVDEKANPDNGGHFCPVCEFEKHSEGFNASDAIHSVATQMRAYAIEQKLVPGVQ